MTREIISSFLFFIKLKAMALRFMSIMNGRLTVLKKTEVNPITPKDMSIPVRPKGAPMVVIIEGQLDHHSISRLLLTEEKVLFLAREQGYHSITDIFLATYTQEKGLIISPYDVVRGNINIEH
ncbi:MAG: hypothetical protein KGZ81_04365 [Flavobacteriales bacterium]|nr:hypothetical protein [Flavobacteriales bacterium]